MGQQYLYDFSASIPGPDITPDYLYPEDAHEQRSIDLLHEMHFYCTMANLAAAIAVRSEELTPPPLQIPSKAVWIPESGFAWKRRRPLSSPMAASFW